MQLTPIAGYEDRYSITKTGEVYSHPYTRCDGRRRKGIWLRAATTRYGYKQVVLTKPDKSRASLSIHRLVASTFLGDGTGLQVNHKNGIKTDNNVDNLEWCTQLQNMQHAHRTGLIDCKSFTPDQVQGIRSLLAKGHKQSYIAEMYNTKQPVVSKIKHGVIYKDTH